VSQRARPQGLRVCESCGSCHFFQRFSDESVVELKQQTLVDDSEAALAVPIMTTERDADVLEYGRCIRNPPQFFSETLSGEWPVVHDSRLCGEYRPNGVQN
jgi:hypothetical protein